MPKFYIISNFTSDLIGDSLTFWGSRLKTEINYEFGPYNQIFQSFLNPSSQLYSPEQVNVLLLWLEDWFKNDNETQLIDTANNLIEAARLYCSKTNNELLIILTSNSPLVKKNRYRADIVAKLEEKISLELSPFSSINVINSKFIENNYISENYFDELSLKLAHIPYKKEYFAALGTMIFRSWYNLRNTGFKAIAIDCDNTLWNGIIGEDGFDGISFGKGNLLLQERLIDLFNKGILICLCSKNNESDVFNVLDNHPQCLLKRNHIVFYRINWLPKSANILSLAKEMNIGADSFLFIDDNPAECDEVRTNSPAAVFVFPEKDSDRIAFVKNNWLLYRSKVTKEDLIRNQFYKEEKCRSDFFAESTSLINFLDNLNLHVNAEPLNRELISRVSQLSLRTNQFNFTTIRMTDDDVSKYYNATDSFCLTTHAKDKFGDYGLVGACFCKVEQSFLLVENFFLSCRALGKGIEYKFLREIEKHARIKNLENITFLFVKTQNNKPALDFWKIIQKSAFESDTIKNKCACTVKTDQIKKILFTSDSYINRSDNDNRQFTEHKMSESALTARQLEQIMMLSDLQSIVNQIYNPHLLLKAANDSTPQSKSDTEKTILDIWRRVLKNNQIQSRDNYFDAGGKSINIPQIIVDIKDATGFEIRMADFFASPSVNMLAEFIYNSINSRQPAQNYGATKQKDKSPVCNDEIAIIGMAGHFPGASDIETFWDNISNGIESISFYTREELEKKGVHPELLNNPDYIYANGVCDDADKFDSTFFGFTPKEADVIDPQQRLLLATCYEALEHSGYAPDKFKGDIGVFAGSGPNNYLLKNLIQHPDLLNSIGELQTITNNGNDYLATRVSYKLNLTGPSFTVQTACSTSLVAVHLACQSLIRNESDIALAGGSFVQTPRENGYMYQKGSIFSSDGHCRPFDKDASGMLFGEGSGIVVLKKLDDAIKDHDFIWAVIKATAINNDGSRKAGYMAPSVEGQAKVIAMAHAKAGIKPQQVTYIETHGTGTIIGDPIEIGALTKVFSGSDSSKNFCAIGSVKANIGHLDAAAGIAGLIKTCLAIFHRQIPPSINFTHSNPDLHIEESPFFVNRQLRDWDTDCGSRIAGVSSFGVGGTNCHCIIGEWLNDTSITSKRPFHLLPFSAKNDNALQKLLDRFSDFFNSKESNIADAAYTLQCGRNEYKSRCVSIIPSTFEKSDFLKSIFIKGKQLSEKPRIVFMFTGQGSQYVNMAKGLYQDFTLFRSIIDKASSAFDNFCEVSLIDVLFDNKNVMPIDNTSVAQPLLFIVQYALSELLKSFGINPSALIGHSIGEITAACVSGVYSFDDALSIVMNRGKIMQTQTPGSMLSINKPVEEISPLMHEGLEISLVNSPQHCVVSGSHDAISNFSEELSKTFNDIQTKKLATSHAFHSYLMEPAMKPFISVFENVKANDIAIPFISNTSGTWISQEQASSPTYWAEHIRKKVDFRSGIKELLKEENSIFIEVGPGNSLSTFLSQFNTKENAICIQTLRHPKKEEKDSVFFLKSVAQVWVNGGEINWGKIYEGESRCRIPLPLYPLEKKKHWIVPVIPFSYHVTDKEYNGSNLPNYQDNDEKTKIDIEDCRSSIESEYTAPETESEKSLVMIWEDLLGIPKIGTSDNFFDLGGHSLLASQILNRLNEKYKTEIPLKAIFDAPTVHELAEIIDNSLHNVNPGIIILRQSEHSAELPVSSEQQRLWIVSKIHNNPAYNIPFTYKLTGKIDYECMRKSLNILFDRHKILKSCIQTKGIQTFCKIDMNSDVTISCIDYSDDRTPLQLSKIDNFLEKEIRELFSVENGPLYRIYLIKTTADEHIFHFNIHHIIFDGWSWGIFVKEFRQIYSDLINNRPVSLPAAQYQYYDYAAWQKQNKLDLSDSVSFWKKQLTGSSQKINFPYDFERKRVSSGFGGRENIAFDEIITGEIKQLSKSENVTDFMVLVSIWAILLKQYSGDNDINIGTPTANRSFTQLEQIIGFFVNSLVLRFKFIENSTFRELLTNTKQVVLDALAHQNLPFEKVVEELKPPRAFNYNPVFQVMFAWQNTPRPPLDLENLSSERFFVRDCAAALDITFYMWENGNIMEGEIEFSTDIIDRETIIRMKKDFVKLINLIMNNPECKTEDIPVFSGR